VKHSRDYSEAEFPALAEYLLAERPPLEAQIIDLVDEIAYNTADLDDGFEAHILDFDQLRAEVPAFGAAYEAVARRHPEGPRKLKFNEALKRILDRLVTDLIENTRAQVKESGVETVEDVRGKAKRLAGFSPDAAAENASLKRFLMSRVYSHPAIAQERGRSVAALDDLFRFFLDHPERMPKHYADLAQIEPRHRIVCDYIAGMTDHFLLRQCHELLGAPSAERR